MRALVILGVLAIAVPAHADSPWVTRLGLVLAQHKYSLDVTDPLYTNNSPDGVGRLGLALHGESAYYLGDDTLVGIHAALSKVSGPYGGSAMNTYVPFELGVTLTHIVFGDAWIAPWAGAWFPLECSMYSVGYGMGPCERLVGYGISVGKDIYTFTPHSHLAWILTFTRTGISPEDRDKEPRYKSVSFGLVVRFGSYGQTATR